MKKTPVKKRKFVPGVIVLEEKHGTAYFHAPDEATLHKVALKILKGRHKAGHWYLKPEPPKTPVYTDRAEIAKLKGDFKDKAVAMLATYKREQASFEEEKLQYENIQKAVLENDGALAWRVIRERSDHEYEKITLEYYSTSYGDI